MTRVRFEIGPVDARLARVWLANSARIVAAARRHRLELSVTIEDPLLDLADAYLEFWRASAEEMETFHWGAEVDPDHVRQLAEQWMRLARLTTEELERMGCHWAPPETAPFFDALLAGTVAALEADPSTRSLAARLRVAPPGHPEPE